jgi:hypothetical protein
MNADVASAHFVQQMAFSRLIEKGNQVPGKQARTPEPEAQGEVLKKGPQPEDQPAAQPEDQPVGQPAGQPGEQHAEQPVAQPNDQPTSY